MKTTLPILAFLLTVACAVHAQVVPGAASGTAALKYTLRYAQNGDFLGGSLGDSQNTVFSGNLNYMNGIKRFPFSLTFAGGYSLNVGGRSYGNGLFENLLFSQEMAGRNWNIQASDNVSYMKEAPITGFSGVPGTGEPIGEPSPTPPSSQTILTINTRTVNNIVSGEYEHILNYATALSVSGSSELLRYPDGNGLDTDDQTASVMLTRRLNARNSFSGQYQFTDYSYSGSNFVLGVSGLVTNSALIGYQRQWTRSISTDVSAGPQWIESPNNAVMPSSTRISGNAKVVDQARFGSADLTYSHGSSGGAGFLSGAEVDSATADFSREFERSLTIQLTGGYRRTSALNNEGEISGEFGAAMATVHLSRYLTAFASYTATDQSTSYSLPTNALTSLFQEISVGVSYSPREKRANSQ